MQGLEKIQKLRRGGGLITYKSIWRQPIYKPLIYVDLSHESMLMLVGFNILGKETWWYGRNSIIRYEDIAT